MKKLNISWYTINQRHKASTRIRIDILHNTISTHSEFSKKYDSMVYRGVHNINKIDMTVDILIIQKVINNSILDFIKNKFKNRLIIFDINDPVATKNISLFKKILSYVNIITVDTKKRKEYINNIYPNSICYIIPDTIDYYPKKFLPPTNYNNIVWFGNRRSFRHIKWYLSFLEKYQYKFNIITALPLFKNEKNPNKKIFNNKNINLISWKEKTFIKNLREKWNMLIVS